MKSDTTPAGVPSKVCVSFERTAEIEGAAAFDLDNDWSCVNVEKVVPFAVLPLMVYVITYASVPFAAPL